MTNSTRWLIGIGAALGGLVVVALVIALATGDRERATYVEDTPEGTVQRYLDVLIDGDTTATYAYLSSEIHARCPIEDWRRDIRYAVDRAGQSQITLKDVDNPTEDEAIVRVTITTFGEPNIIPVPPDQNSFDREFVLVKQSDGMWTFSEIPWPVFGCSVREVRPAELATPTPLPTPVPASEQPTR